MNRPSRLSSSEVHSASHILFRVMWMCLCAGPTGLKRATELLFSDLWKCPVLDSFCIVNLGSIPPQELETNRPSQILRFITPRHDPSTLRIENGQLSATQEAEDAA
jgi:hypothetical protein